MSPVGDADLLIAARRALLDALDALVEQLDALVLVGAQAIYLHTGATDIALAEATKDSDLAVDPRHLVADPLLENSMERAGFHRDLISPQPGSWLSPAGIPVDLMVPEKLAGRGGRRGGRIPPHSRHATRCAAGLEAAVVDNEVRMITALDPHDRRQTSVSVAGPAALMVAKLHKLGERQNARDRLVDKDAHDIYRLLVAIDTEVLARNLARLGRDDLAGPVTGQAIQYLRVLFSEPAAAGATMAGRAEELVGDPAFVSAAATELARDLLARLDGYG